MWAIKSIESFWRLPKEDSMGKLIPIILLAGVLCALYLRKQSKCSKRPNSASTVQL